MSCACLVIDIVVVLWSHHHTNQPNHLTSGDDLLRCYCNTVVQMGYAWRNEIEWVEIMLEYCDMGRQMQANMHTDVYALQIAIYFI